MLQVQPRKPLAHAAVVDALTAVAAAVEGIAEAYLVGYQFIGADIVTADLFVVVVGEGFTANAVERHIEAKLVSAIPPEHAVTQFGTKVFDLVVGRAKLAQSGFTLDQVKQSGSLLFRSPTLPPATVDARPWWKFW